MTRHYSDATRQRLVLMFPSSETQIFDAALGLIERRNNDRWMPSTDGIEHDDVLRTQHLVNELTDGLWMHDHVHEQGLTPAQREALTSQILQMLE